jgi:hypothetical protein
MVQIMPGLQTLVHRHGQQLLVNQQRLQGLELQMLLRQQVQQYLQIKLALLVNGLTTVDLLLRYQHRHSVH